jgi:short-subunit dehydrogenase
MKKVLIIGATSAIAIAVARKLAARGDRLYLLARDRAHLDDLAVDLNIRGAESVNYAEFDANQLDRLQPILDQAMQTLNGVDIALIAYGSLPDQRSCEQNLALTLQEFHTNAISVIALLTLLANIMRPRGQGTLVAISSVAGDRGRQSNYIYGAAKGAVSLFLQGLRNRLAESGVRVVTIKPGLVDTPMTRTFKKGPLWATPERVADGICTAIDNGRDVVYLPWYWRYIMLVIKTVPERIFKRLSL